MDVADRFGCTPLYYAALANRIHNVTVRSTCMVCSTDGRITVCAYQRFHDHLTQQALMELFEKSKEQRANPLLPTRDGDSPWLVAGQWSHLRDAMGRDQRAFFEAMQKRVVRIVSYRIVACRVMCSAINP